MTTSAVRCIVWCSLSLIVAAIGAGASEPVAVSPGSVGETVLVGEPCPTFSWAEVEGGKAYEVAVWRLPAEADHDGEPETVILKTLPGGAQGWTPSLGECLKRGERYAWAVRVEKVGGAEVWSEPAYFQVAAGPSEEEFQQALAVVRQYLATTGAATAPSTEATAGLPTAAERESRPAVGAVTAREKASKALATSPAAIHAELSAVSGEVVGIRGVVNSSGGAAGAFNNTAGGTILSGLSNGTEVFNVDSSGNVEAATFDGDGSNITNLDPANLGTGTASINITGNAANVTGTIAIANGGTGATTALAARTNLGAAGIFSELTGVLQDGQFSGTYSNAVALNNASNTFAGDGSGLTGISATDPTKVLKSGDTMTGALNFTLSSTQIRSGDSGKDLILDADTDEFSDISLRADGDIDIDADDDAFLIATDRVELQTSTGRIELDSGDDVQIFVGSGNGVGIETTGVSFLLEVNGSAGKPGGGMWSDSSDARLKRNVLYLDSATALEMLSRLQGVTFEWVHPEQHLEGTRAGFVAQAVEEVFPSWVQEVEPHGKDVKLVPPGGKVKAIGFPNDFIAYLIEALKELKTRNEMLRERVEALESSSSLSAKAE